MSVTLRKAAVEFYLNNLAPKPALLNPAWDIDASRLSTVKVRWPDRYEWHAAADWVDVLLYGFRKLVQVEIVSDIPQKYKGTVNFQLIINGKIRRVAIGYSDYRSLDEGCTAESDLYFKMQFDRNGCPQTNVVPGGYVPDGRRLYFYLKKLRRQRDRLNFAHDVSGRFSLNYARAIREEAVTRLSSQQKFRFTGGMSTVSYGGFLREIAQSKICIDLPGLGDFCFRLVNYLAIGTCVIAYPHGSIMHVPLIDREHIVYCKPDFSDLNELCEYYLSHDAEREEIAQNGRRYFDENLHKDNLARYYLHTCLDRLA